MVNRTLKPDTAGGLAFSESGTDYNGKIDPSAITTVTSILSSNHAIVSVSDVVKKITLANLITQLSILTGETDPVFLASAAYAIATGDITNWNLAYGWGDHSLIGYLTTALHDLTARHTVGAVVPHDNLASLGDVTITGLADNDVVAYDNTSGKYKNQSASQAGLATSTHTQATAKGGTGQDSSAWTGYAYITAGVWSTAAISPSLITGLTTPLPFQLQGDTAKTDSSNVWAMQSKIKVPTGCTKIVGLSITSMSYKSGSAGIVTYAVNNVAYDGGGSPITLPLDGNTYYGDATGSIAVTGGTDFAYVFISSMTGQGHSNPSGVVWVEV